LLHRHISRAAGELTRALRAHRQPLAEAFAAALEPTSKWKPLMEAKRLDWDGFVQTEFYAFVDYLAEYFARGDCTFRQLFVGEKIKSLYDPALDDAARRALGDAALGKCSSRISPRRPGNCSSRCSTRSGTCCCDRARGHSVCC